MAALELDEELLDVNVRLEEELELLDWMAALELEDDDWMAALDELEDSSSSVYVISMTRLSQFILTAAPVVFGVRT